MKTSSSLTRRYFIAGTGAAISTTALATTVAPVVASDPEQAKCEQSELIRLFSDWDACDREAWHVESDEESDALCDRMHQIEIAMIAIPATTAAEFAAKIIAFTSYGDWLPSREFIAESAAVCGASRASELAGATAERDP